MGRIAFNKRYIFVFLSVFSLGFLSVMFNNFIPSSQLQQNASTSMEHSSDENFVPGRLLIQPKPGITEEELEKLVQFHGSKQVGHIKQINVRILELPPQASEKAVEALLNHHPLLNFAERDMIVKPSLITNDPYFSNSWHLPKINAPAAWDITTGDGITIAIIDTGVQLDHPDLKNNLISGWNFYDGNSDPSDIHGHGTSVAGAAAASINNGLGISSVAGTARIMPLRVGSPTDGSASFSNMARAVTYAADNGARVANLSYQGPSGSSTVQSAGSYLQGKGGLLVVGAGNTGGEQLFSNSSSLISVSATDGNDARPSWSSYGSYIDISAPGVGIYVTRKGSTYGTASGTSFSSPIVAGVVALIMVANPSLPPKQVENILLSTAKDIGTSGWDVYYGHGRVDAAAAVQLAKNTVANDTTNPVVTITSPANNAKIVGVVPVTVSASDNVSLSRVELYVGSNLLASDNQVPYEFSFNSSLLPDGNVTLTAKAIDSSGNSASSSTTVTIDNIQDLTPPVVNILSPSAGSIVKGKITISAKATDNEAVASMNLYIDGVLKASSSVNSISMVWNTRKVSTGIHTIRVEAKDLSGNISSSSIQVSK